MFRTEERDWGLAMMLSHGVIGAAIAIEIGELFWRPYFYEVLSPDIGYQLADVLKSIGIAAISGFLGGCVMSNLFYGSSPYFFWSKPKSVINDSHSPLNSDVGKSRYL